MDVAAGREVHHRVGAPTDRPHHLLDFLGDARAHRGIADVGVDLDQKIAADRHRLEFEVIDVGGNDRPPARHLLAHEFRRDEFGNGGAEALAVGEALGGALHRRLAREILAMGDIDHLFGDDPGAGEFELGDELAGLACAQRALRGAERRETIRRDVAVVLGLDRARLRYGESCAPRSRPRAPAAGRRRDRSPRCFRYRARTDRRPGPAPRSGRRARSRETERGCPARPLGAA